MDDFIELKRIAGLGELQKEVGKDYLSEHSFSLLNNSFSENVNNLILEYPYVDKDFRSTYYSDFSKRHKDINRNSYRVHLFGEGEEEYCGFFTLRNTPPCNLGRAYLDPKAFSVPPGHFLLAELKTHIAGKSFTTSAFPWMQQDANISRCAQVAIWSIARYYSEKYSFYAEHTLQQIFDLASSYKRKIPSKGLTVEGVSEIFNSIGFHPEVYFSQFIENRKLFDEILYVFIESGIPLVAALGSKKHAIALTGHLTIGQGMHDNENQVIPVSNMVRGYFSVDDNILPYSIVGSGGQYTVEDIDTIIVPLHEKMYLDVLTLLERILPSVEETYLPHQNMYRRVFLTSSKSLKSFVLNNSADKKYKTICRMPMPKFIWVAEYIEKEHYPDSIHSRLIFDATAMEYDRIEAIMMSARVGSELISGRETLELNNLPEPLYRNNLTEVEL